MFGIFGAAQKESEIILTPIVTNASKAAGMVSTARDTILNVIPTPLKTLASKVNNITGSPILDELAVGNIAYAASVASGAASGYYCVDTVKDLVAKKRKPALKDAGYSLALGFTACLLNSTPAGLAVVAKSIAGGAAFNILKTSYYAWLGNRKWRVVFELVDANAKPLIRAKRPSQVKTKQPNNTNPVPAIKANAAAQQPAKTVSPKSQPAVKTAKTS